MSDYFDVPIVFTGDWIDAAWINQYIGDNFRAFKQGFVNAGDLPYAVDGDTIGALAKPGGLGLLSNNAAGTLAWVTGGSALQVLRKNAANTGYEWAGIKGLHAVTSKTWDGPDTFTSTSFGSITSAANLVTTKTCTIVAVASGVFAVGTAGWRGLVRVLIGGVAFKEVHTSNPYYVPYAAINIRTGVTAGTIAIQPQARVNAGGESLTTERGGLLALAFEE